MLQELGEKLRVEVTRFGRTSVNSKGETMPRPVKIIVANSLSARQIRLKAKNLRDTEKFRSVFIAPDRSPAERATQKQLVLDMKKKGEEQ